jgi:hypothetical protein
MGVDRDDWPVLVRMGLWGLPSRALAWAFFWLSLAITAACIAYGFINPVGFVGGLLVFAAFWYYLSIRWVDRHGRWE